jgi:hypothetical protein
VIRYSAAPCQTDMPNPLDRRPRSIGAPRIRPRAALDRPLSSGENVRRIRAAKLAGSGGG